MDGNDNKEVKPFLKSDGLPTISKVAPPAASGKSARGKALRQVLASFVANLGTINTGMAFGFPAVAVPELLLPDSFIHIDKGQGSWIASLSAAGTPFGCILSGYLMDAIGRKLTLILSEVPLILGWVLIAAAQNVPMIYVGRLLVGLGSGMIGAPARVYTCEVAQPHLRGMLGALASVGVSLGVLIQYVLGYFLRWNEVAACSAVIPVVSLLGMLLMPETPNYLLTSNRREMAQKSLIKLRGSIYDVDGEIQAMLAFKEKNHVEPLKGSRAVLKALLSPSTLKPFGILATYFFLYQWCGVNVITTYAINVFRDSGATMDSKVLTIVLGIVRLIFTGVGCVMLRRCGRRPLTFVSSIGCGSTMLALGTYSYWNNSWKSMDLPAMMTWIPVVCILLFIIFCTMGFLIVPWVMIGEVYPTQVRGVVGGMTTCVAHMSVFVVVKTYPMLVDVMETYGTYWLYGSLSILGTIFFFFYLPETKGRTLQEIEDYFCGRTKKLTKPKSPQANSA